MSQPPAPPSSEKPMSQRATLVVSLLAVLIIVMIYLFWQGTWFGRELSDEQISEYLADEDKPRNAQHVIAQISQRISQGDESVKKWYPRIVALADHPLAQLRVNAAWLMGQDNKSGQFHEKLKQLLADSDPRVRRNAALSLIRFNDVSGRQELLGMLGDFTVHSPHSGVFTNRLAMDDVVDGGTLLARVEVKGQEEPAEVRSPLPGVIKKRLLRDGAAVRAGDPVMLLGPGATHVYEALRALYLVGKPEDVESIRRFLRPAENFPEKVAQQAGLTVEMIRKRRNQ